MTIQELVGRKYTVQELEGAHIPEGGYVTCGNRTESVICVRTISGCVLLTKKGFSMLEEAVKGLPAQVPASRKLRRFFLESAVEVEAESGGYFLPESILEVMKSKTTERIWQLDSPDEELAVAVLVSESRMLDSII